MVFSVALELHVAESVIGAYPASRLLERYEWVLEAQWEATTSQIAAVELGVTRALMQAFGETPEKLPSYDDVIAQQEQSEAQLPTWMQEFERVNADRRVVRGQHGCRTLPGSQP